MKEYKRLKDPIYGYINIPMDYMTDIVDTPTFQRLRRIIQTSYSPLFSSAVHNRFVHSLGVFHLGTIAMEQLSSELNKYLTKSDGEKEEIKENCKIFLLACLLHDVGHAPFSHTGENLYLDGQGNDRYIKLHDELKQLVDSESFSEDIPVTTSSAAAHEIMSAIVGLRSFPDCFNTVEKRELFARCITGYIYTKKEKSAAIKNCFISLLNSKVIDVDKLDYLIRDAYITGFNTVNIDYERLLKAITIVDVDADIKLAYYKDAISVIENVVYAHDAERKWIQNHPVVLYECYILNHIFEYLRKELDLKDKKLFSYESLTSEGQILNHQVKVSLMCDDDLVYIMKNILPCAIGKEFFSRSLRRHPLWKSEAEYQALFSGTIGGQNDSMGEFENAMNATAMYLAGTSDTWMINDEAVRKIKTDLNNLDKQSLDDKTKKVQRNQKEKVLRLMECLLKFANENQHECDFVILEASQFNSGFSKPDFSQMPIIFNTSENDYVECKFGEVANPLKANKPERKKFYYLFYRRQDKNRKEIDKKQLCEYLAKEFTTLATRSRSGR